MTPAPSPALRTADGGHLHFQSWQPTANPRAAVLLAHGVGEHTGRYEWLARRLMERQIAVHAWDHRGHGLSTGRRGHVSSWTEYREDLRLSLEHARTQSAPGLPVFLLGHSMGALVALDAALHLPLPLAGLAVSGAPLQPAGVAKPHLILLARVLSRIWPVFPLPLPITPEQLISRPQDLAALAADPLLHGTVTARWGMEAMRTLDAVRAATPNLRLPLLVLHGAQDPVNRVAGAHWLLEQAGSTDKELRVYPQSRHEPHQDIERETFVRDFADWVLARV